VAMLATTWLVVTSTRSTRELPQQGTQTLPKPTPNPEHGARPTGTFAITLSVFGSIREMLSLAILEIQTASFPIATQSGLPGIEIFARMGSAEIGRWTRCKSMLIVPPI
jgi:hypothetical protein